MTTHNLTYCTTWNNEKPTVLYKFHNDPKAKDVLERYKLLLELIAIVIGILVGVKTLV